MKKIKSLIAMASVGILIMGSLAGCGSKTNGNGTQTAKAKEIYFLNFKPEVADVYKSIAEEYKKETGVTVKVVTAASGTYETTLKAEIAKSDAPSIFQINGPVGYQNWKDYCADLSGTKFYSYLTDKSLAVKSGNGVYGIPYVEEGYGIIYNDAIMKKYFALSDKAVSITSTAQINNFDLLSKVVTDMTKHKAQLGIKGVFGSTSLKTGEDWRWQTHLANMPFYYEFKDNTKYTDTILAGVNSKTVDFKYANNFKNIFDLYINNSCTSPKLLGSKSVDDSMAEFALGNVAMAQNGDWAWSQISKVAGNTVNAADVHFLPIYTGVQGEETQGLCIGTENYFAINSKVSKSEQDASIAFLEWLYSSKTGKDFVTNKLGFIAPFSTFTAADQPTDPLAKEVISWMSNKNVKTVPWTFESFPSQNFKNAFGAALLQYAQGTQKWDTVVKTVKDTWASEASK